MFLRCTIAVLLLSLTIVAQTKPQPQLKKFAFMEGQFKERTTNGIVTGTFSPDGKEFRWHYKAGERTSDGAILYDASTKKYFLTETVNGAQTTYYEGIETQHGFPFRALTGKGGAPDEKGDSIRLMPIPQMGVLPDTKMVNMVRLRKNAEGKYEKYYDGLYYVQPSPDQLAKANKEGLRRLDFLVGRFKEDGREGEVIGKYEGDKYVWRYQSARNTSDAVATYNFHNDRFTLIEKIGDAETKYEGQYQDRALVLWSNSATRKQLILRTPEYGKVLMTRKTEDTTDYEGTYTKIEEANSK